MRVQVNLATRPYVELQPFFLRLRLIMAALAVVGLGLFFWAHALTVKAERQQIALDRVRNQTIAAQESKLHVEQRMRDPVNAAVLDRAHFLNRLFLRKSFSWTAVMMDLENVLPIGVQVTSIEPAVASNGDVVIRLRVAGERDRAVQLVRNLERSHRFLQPRLSGESAQAKENAVANGPRPFPGSAPQQVGPPGVEFEILANYNPLPAGQPYVQGHGGHASAAAQGVTAIGTEGALPRTSRRAAQGNNPATNVQNGYPPYGLRLDPSTGASASQFLHHAPLPPHPSTQGAPQ